MEVKCSFLEFKKIAKKKINFTHNHDTQRYLAGICVSPSRYFLYTFKHANKPLIHILYIYNLLHTQTLNYTYYIAF